MSDSNELLSKPLNYLLILEYFSNHSPIDVIIFKFNPSNFKIFQKLFLHVEYLNFRLKVH